MWHDIQFNPKQVSDAIRYRCDWLVENMPAYDPAVFREMEDARHMFGSLRTEGSTLTFVEVSMVLRGELPRDAKNLDVREGISLQAALHEMRELIGVLPFSEEIVKRVHKTCANGHLAAKNCGEYRTIQNYIGDGSFSTAVPNQIPKLMRRLFEAIKNEGNPIVKAAFFGFNYVAIHPFADYNGRTSRLFECYLLGEGGMPFISMREEDIRLYLDLMRDGCKNGKPYYEPYIEFVMNRVEERFEELKRDFEINGGYSENS